MNRRPRCIYLHGFASGPSSTKAAFFSSKLRQIGFQVDVPDLNGPSFETMTISSELQIIDDLIDSLCSDDSLLLFGSSMGGLLATLKAQQSPQLRGMVLLAPAFGLPRRWTQLLGAQGLDKWRADGYTEVFHYALNRNARLSYEFIVDAQRYETDNLSVSVPTIVLHGKKDETVPVAESIHFAELNPDLVELHLLEADHALLEPLESMWATISQFLIDRVLPLELVHESVKFNQQDKNR